jgi:hypothetical protein
MDLPPDGKAAQLGPGSVFGCEKPFQFFNLPAARSVLPPTKLGIRSVSATLKIM